MPSKDELAAIRAGAAAKLPAKTLATMLYAELNADYTRRPEPAEMLPAIRAPGQRRVA